MGRRKERRAAAASMASGRRVKLDLFAEPPPSSDDGEKLINKDEEKEEEEEEEEEEEMMDYRNNNITSGEQPTSSGKRQDRDNPLSLLGQYSDEEQPTNVSSSQTLLASADQLAQIEEFVKTCGDVEDTTIEEFPVENIKQEGLAKESPCSNAAKDLESSGVEEIGSVPLDDPHKGEESTALVSDPWTSGIQNAGEVSFGWKLVMHEESNQYYYWNVETGETSWEVPAIFSQGTELATEQKVLPVIEEGEITPSNTEASCTLSLAAGDHYNGSCLISHDEKWKPMDQEKIKNEEYKDGNVVYSELNSGILQTEPQSTGNRTSPGSIGMSLVANEPHAAGFANPMQLVSYAESLIQQLKDIGSSGIQIQGWDWVSRYIFEIEIRLSDFKSLLAYGSSLLPFWVYSEEKLKVLERAINDHIFQFTNSGHKNEFDTENISHSIEDGTSRQSTGGDPELNIEDQPVVPSRPHPGSSPNINSSDIQKEAEDISTLNTVDVKPSESPSQYVHSVASGDIQQVDEMVLLKGLVLQSVSSAIVDEDMDVDMEVDDETTTSDQRSINTLGANCLSPQEHFTQPVPPGNLSTSLSEKEYDVPPPPEEDWIPPPPPDAEPVPPPPPDAEPVPPLPPDYPPAPTYTAQPLYSETVPHLPYGEQYNISYPVSSSELYVSMLTGPPSSNYYAHSEESQAAVPQPAQYYDTLPATYSQTTSVIANPMDSSVYYEIPNATLPPLPAISCFGSSGFYGQSDSVSYHNTTADHAGSLNLAQSEYSSLPNLKGESDTLVVCHETETVAAKTSPISTTVQATTSAAPVPLTSADSSASVPSTTAAKVPTKVLRSKKRTIAMAPTLRSNKKVSSLVDKWKAAKEELHEDEEDEPQNAYEILERKRQKEIEAWRAHQISTGEAKDNANFQPLGGDWRERVKRRRAQLTRESGRSQLDAPKDGNQTPDSTEPCKDLPSGWQAYWDESSQKTYYGNSITMETTWTRPTQ